MKISSNIFTEFIQRPDFVQGNNTSLEKHFPELFDYPSRNFNNFNEVTSEIRKVYMKNQDVTNETASELGVCFSDSIISYPVNRLANLFRKHSEIYVYQFEYKGVFTEASNQVGHPVDVGVVHADDLQYLFSSNRAPRYTPLDKEHKIVDMMTSVFVNFASRG